MYYYVYVLRSEYDGNNYVGYIPITGMRLQCVPNRYYLPCALAQGKRGAAKQGFSPSIKAKASSVIASKYPALKDGVRNNLLFTIVQSSRIPLPCSLEQGKKAVVKGKKASAQVISRITKAGFNPKYISLWHT